MTAGEMSWLSVPSAFFRATVKQEFRSWIVHDEITLAPLVGEGLEEHEHHHARDRNVEPDGKRPPRDSAVHREPACQREKKSYQHHGQRDDGKEDVAGQDGKVQRAHRAVAWENRIAVQSVVHDIADEKYGREGEGQQHAQAVSFPVSMLDEIKSQAKRHRAQSVQQRVEGRQEHPAPGEIRRSAVHVQQPQQKRYRKTAHDDDRADRRTRIAFRLFHSVN